MRCNKNHVTTQHGAWWVTSQTCCTFSFENGSEMLDICLLIERTADIRLSSPLRPGTPRVSPLLPAPTFQNDTFLFRFFTASEFFLFLLLSFGKYILDVSAPFANSVSFKVPLLITDIEVFLLQSSTLWSSDDQSESRRISNILTIHSLKCECLKELCEQSPQTIRFNCA